MHVRCDVTKWRRAFLLWKKPEEKLSKMADVQIQKTTTGFGLFSSISKGKNSLLFLLTSNLSFSYSFKLHNKIWLLAFRSPLMCYKVLWWLGVSRLLELKLPC